MNNNSILSNPDSTKPSDLVISIENEREILSQMNWHGVSLGFSNHYKDRQYKDLSIFKSSKLAAIKAAEKYQNLAQKKIFQEYDHCQQVLALKKKREKAKHLRLITLLANNKALENKMVQAAVVIQRHARGYLIRNRYKDQLKAIQMKKLSVKVESLENAIEYCFNHIGNSPNKAALTLQKNVKKFLAVRKFMKIKNAAVENQYKKKVQSAILIQSHIRKFLDIKKVEKIKKEIKLKNSLEKIRQRLLVLRLKEFWHRKKFVWVTIRKKYMERSDMNSSEINEKSNDTISEPIQSITKPESKPKSSLPSKRGTIILKEPLVPKTIVQAALVPKPPKAPKSLKPQIVPEGPRTLTMKYLKPTENYIHKTSKETEESKPVKSFKIKTITGKRYQRNTTSRVNYMHELNVEYKSSKRAVSADYAKSKRLSVGTQALSPSFINEFISSYKNNDAKSPTSTQLLKKIEDAPVPVFEEAIEKIYVYNPPKPQSLSFKEALPDVNLLLENYAKALKLQK